MLWVASRLAPLGLFLFDGLGGVSCTNKMCNRKKPVNEIQFAQSAFECNAAAHSQGWEWLSYSLSMTPSSHSGLTEINWSSQNQFFRIISSLFLVTKSISVLNKTFCVCLTDDVAGLKIGDSLIFMYFCIHSIIKKSEKRWIWWSKNKQRSSRWSDGDKNRNFSRLKDWTLLPVLPACSLVNREHSRLLFKVGRNKTETRVFHRIKFSKRPQIFWLELKLMAIIRRQQS